MEITKEALAAARTNEARAVLWEKALNAGLILTFRTNDGAVLTAGPNHTATGTGPAFSVYREQGEYRWRGAWEGDAYQMAHRIVSHVGRKSPVRVVQGRPAK